MWPPKSPYPSQQATQTALRMLHLDEETESALNFDTFCKLHKSLGEEDWKQAWKLNYMKRLDLLANTAWQNNLKRK